MTTKYECYYCKKSFPATKGIDAYDQGYKVGFLCPECGKNIQAGMLAKQKLGPEHYKWVFITFLLYMPILFTRKSETTFNILNYEVNLNTILFTTWLAYIVILLILKPSLFMAKKFLTEPVNEKS